MKAGVWRCAMSAWVAALLVPGVAIAMTTDLAQQARMLDQLEQLDALDREEFLSLTDQAKECIAQRRYSCAERAMKEAEAYMTEPGDRAWLVALADGVAAEKRAEEMERRIARQQQEAWEREEARERAARNTQMWMQAMTTVGAGIQEGYAQHQREQEAFNARIAQVTREAEAQRQAQQARQQARQAEELRQEQARQRARQQQQAVLTPGQAQQSEADQRRQEQAQRQQEQERLHQEQQAQRRQAAEREQQRQEALMRQEQERQRKEQEAQRLAAEQRALEAQKKQERQQYAYAVRAGTRMGALSCGHSEGKVRLVGTLGRAKRPTHVYSDCRVTTARYRCASESHWRTYSNQGWMLNNACIGMGDDVVVNVNCPAEQVLVEAVAFSCDER